MLQHTCIIKIAVLLLATSTFLVDGYIRGNDWKDLLLNSAEKNALDEFKEKVVHRMPEEYMKTDFYLIRWIRATNLNVGAAQNLLFQNLKWRADNEINKILEEDWSDMREDFPVALDGSDKRDRPVGTMDLGQWDLRAAVLQGKLPRLLRYMDWYQETLIHRILDAQAAGKNVTRGMVLVDIEGFNLLQHFCGSCVSVFIRMTQGMESHYPGFWEEIVVINAPRGSRVGLDAVRPVMSRQTREILKIYDTNKSQWMEYLDERISRDERATNYGGTRKNKEI